MGRPPLSGRKKKIGQFEKDKMKSLHRNADSKYRSKVQYLYGKLREMIQTNTAKEVLIEETLMHIQGLESQICSSPENYKEEFLNFLVHEESLWKREKDLNKWWSKVEECLDVDSAGPVVDENSEFSNASHSNNCSEKSNPPVEAQESESSSKEEEGTFERKFNQYRLPPLCEEYPGKFVDVNIKRNPSSVELWSPAEKRQCNIGLKHDTERTFEEVEDIPPIFEDQDLFTDLSQKTVTEVFIDDSAQPCGSLLHL